MAKAASRGADVIVLDLEDGVAPAAKDRARDALASAAANLRDQGATVFVRVNGDAALFGADVRAAVRAGAGAIVLPKVETTGQIAQLERELAGLGSPAQVMALIESPLGVCRAAEIARSSQRLLGLCFGSEDFAAAMGVQPLPESLGWPAHAVAVAAVAAGIQPLGLVGSVAGFSDLGGYRELARRSRAIGMRGSVCIHPAQVGILNEVFGASETEIAEAEKIVAAFDAALRDGRGAIAIDGRMVDEPVAQRARLLLVRNKTRSQSK